MNTSFKPFRTFEARAGHQVRRLSSSFLLSLARQAAHDTKTAMLTRERPLQVLDAAFSPSGDAFLVATGATQVKLYDRDGLELCVPLPPSCSSTRVRADCEVCAQRRVQQGRHVHPRLAQHRVRAARSLLASSSPPLTPDPSPSPPSRLPRLFLPLLPSPLFPRLASCSSRSPPPLLARSPVLPSPQRPRRRHHLARLPPLGPLAVPHRLGRLDPAHLGPRQPPQEQERRRRQEQGARRQDQGDELLLERRWEVDRGRCVGGSLLLGSRATTLWRRRPGSKRGWRLPS